MTLKVLKVFETRNVPYTGKDGQQQVFTIKGFQLTDGYNTFYAEATQDVARVCDTLNVKEGNFVFVHLQHTVRQYADAAGQPRQSNEVRIVSMMVD